MLQRHCIHPMIVIVRPWRTKNECVGKILVSVLYPRTESTISKKRSLYPTQTNPESHPKPNHGSNLAVTPLQKVKVAHVSRCQPTTDPSRSDSPLSIYQNLAAGFLNFLSCFNPLISILFANPVAVAYPVPVPVPTGRPLLPGMG